MSVCVLFSALVCDDFQEDVARRQYVPERRMRRMIVADGERILQTAGRREAGDRIRHRLSHQARAQIRIVYEGLRIDKIISKKISIIENLGLHPRKYTAKKCIVKRKKLSDHDRFLPKMSQKEIAKRPGKLRIGYPLAHTIASKAVYLEGFLIDIGVIGRTHVHLKCIENIEPIVQYGARALYESISIRIKSRRLRIDDEIDAAFFIV